jgi:hypothetical protein
MPDREDDGGDVGRTKKPGGETKPSLANVMDFTNLSYGQRTSGPVEL